MSSSTGSSLDTSMCDHLRWYLKLDKDIQVKVEEGIEERDVEGENRMAQTKKRFVEVVRWGAVQEGVKRRKTSPPRCSTCQAVVARPWSCLTCPMMGCAPVSTSSGSKGCLQAHWGAENSPCAFGVDPSSGAIWCSECNDAIYPDTFESLYLESKVKMEEEQDVSREVSNLNRKRGSWQVSSGDTSTLDLAKASCRGLRPLLNLSQTCFLSAILQSLIHNPMFKAHFLGEKHNRHTCTTGGKGLAVGKPDIARDANGAVLPLRDKGCMCCEMDRAFEEFYNEDKSPFGPVTMLYSMWHASAELEGHGQQDAHSFFLAALDQIHAHAKGQLVGCNCIAHQTFAGSLLSSVTCSSCSQTSTTVDPILDVQLDFSPTSPIEDLTLAGMLRRFCASEDVGDIGKGYDCASCGGGPGVTASRKLLLKKLPNVLSFQLKRFAHNATSTKVEYPVRFPSKLDMRPYVEASSTVLPDSLYLYDLFAVVTHEGKLDNGHYWADVLCGDEWWHCDDDKVTPTTLSSVLAQKAYMLFYMKRTLAYAQPPKPQVNGVAAAVGGAASKSVAGKTMGGKSGHPIKGMAM